MMINLQSSPLPYTPPPPPNPGSTRTLYNMRSLSDPRVPPALVSTLTAALPQFHHDFNTFDHLYTHNLLPLQTYLNNITNTVDKLLSTTAESILGLRLPQPHKHHDLHNLHLPPTHTPQKISKSLLLPFPRKVELQLLVIVSDGLKPFR